MKKQKLKVVIVASLLALGGSTVLPVVQQVKADSVDSEVTTLNVKKSQEAMKVNLEESKVPVRLANSSIGAGGGSAVGGIGAGIAAGIAGLGSIHLFKEHTKNKRKSTHDKHTKPRPGRKSEKKKNSKKWNGKHSRHH